jgi:ABC-type sugar transport system ATPase subunit
MARVELEHVEKVYPGGTRAIRDFSLDVADGELLVMVGPSGCGKSTILRLVAGLEEPTGGTVKIGGRSMNAVRPQDRNAAMVFQDYALYPHLTVEGNLEFPLKMRRLPRAERRTSVARVADLLEIGALLDRLPRQLSGGQRQRVAMGRALVREPAVFLLDEPLSNLDARLRVQVRAEIKALQRRTKTTMLYVTHDQVEAMTLGDRVAILDQGVLQQVAPPAPLYARPANVFVAGFIGNPPMNVFPATLGADAVLRVGNQTVRLDAARAALAGRVATAGVRPEAVGLGDDGLDATVTHVEYLGHESLVYAALAGNEAIRLVARRPGMEPLATGARVRLAFAARQVHLFAADGASLG